MTLNITIPENINDTKPKISVIGIGGAGGNAVNTMINEKIENIDFLVANTDGQALSRSLTSKQIQLGKSITSGVGAGSDAETGRKAAEETIRQQGEVITVLREENKRLVSELQTFKGEIQSKVKGHVEKIKEDLQFKHAFIVVQNKQLQNQVIAQKAQKAALVTQIEGLDHRMAALEDAVGTD